MLSLLGVLSFITNYAYQQGILSVSKVNNQAFNELSKQLEIAKIDLIMIREKTQNNLNALALQTGKQQAQLFRLEALGKQLTEMGHLDSKEFNFSSTPAIGGARSETLQQSHTKKEINQLFELEQKMQDREVQLNILQQVLMHHKLEAASYPSGRPVLKGFISSKYGRRPDPKTGKGAYHHGIDFAGNAIGDPVIAVASGVVIYSEKQRGYGNIVEIRHPDGYTTRYAHNQKNLVNKGDIVHKDQVIAYVGSTGKSTGPHVHFEVHKNGKAVNPAHYLN